LGYIRQLLSTYLVRILLIPVGLLYSVVTARWLGPSDLGIFAAIGTALLLAATLANLGLPIAVMRAAASRPEQTGRLIANARLTGAVGGLAAIAVLVGWYRVAPASAGAIPFDLMVLASLALPLTLGSSQFQSVVLGRQRVGDYNMMEVLNRVPLLLGSLAVLVLLGLGVRELVILTVVLAVAQYLVYHAILWPESATWKPDLQLLRGIGGVSFRAYITVLLYFLVVRSDILVINAILGSTATGIYNVAVQGADALILLPAVAGVILLPRVAADGGERSAELTALVSRHIAFVMGVACLLTALVCWWVVRWLFGAPYQEAAFALWLLLPGVWCVSIQNILHQDLSGRDYPLYLPGVWSVVLTINVGLNLLLLPRVGIAAAAISSSVAYATAGLLLSRYWLRRFPGLRPRHLLRLEREEVRALWGRFTASLSRRQQPERHSA
jgi:O-antigen/teichoic acid export membrane protein